MTLPFHPHATIFPPIEGAEFEELVENIRRHGIRENIVLLDEQVLDGRNRYRALAWLASTGETLGDGWGHRAGLHLTADELAPDNIWFTRFNPGLDGDPLDFVISKNLRRRHLTEGQRAMVAVGIANVRQGQRTDLEPSANLPKVDQAAAAKLLNVSERSLRTAKVVKAQGVPEVQQAVESGKLSISAAAQLAMQSQARQENVLALLPRSADGKLAPDVKKALGPVIKELRAEQQAAKRERREEREQQLGGKLQALAAKRYGVAIEDFEWDHEAWSRESGLDRHPSNHYETAADAHTPEEIVERCRERFAALADDCILFKWVTNPHLAIGIKTLELQGFKYVTNLSWNKLRNGNGRGPGYWFTGEHELVLVGVRGKVVPPSHAHFRSTFDAPVGAHSEKPDNLHGIIEHHWPSVPKIEFNGRRARAGWTVWGKGAPDSVIASEAKQSSTEPAADAALDRHAAAPLAMTADTEHADAHGCTASFAADAAELPVASALFSDRDRTEWKALGAVQGGVTIDGPIVRELIDDGLIVRDFDDGLVITDEGEGRLAALEAQFNPPPRPAEAADQLDIPDFLRRRREVAA